MATKKSAVEKVTFEEDPPTGWNVMAGPLGFAVGYHNSAVVRKEMWEKVLAEHTNCYGMPSSPSKFFLMANVLGAAAFIYYDMDKNAAIFGLAASTVDNTIPPEAEDMEEDLDIMLEAAHQMGLPCYQEVPDLDQRDVTKLLN